MHEIALEPQEQVLAVGVDRDDRAPVRAATGQRSSAWRGWGVRISSGTWPSSTGRIRFAA